MMADILGKMHVIPCSTTLRTLFRDAKLNPWFLSGMSIECYRYLILGGGRVHHGPRSRKTALLANLTNQIKVRTGEVERPG